MTGKPTFRFDINQEYLGYLSRCTHLKKSFEKLLVMISKLFLHETFFFVLSKLLFGERRQIGQTNVFAPQMDRIQCPLSLELFFGECSTKWIKEGS